MKKETTKKLTEQTFSKIERKAEAEVLLSKISAIFSVAESRGLFYKAAELMEDYLQKSFEILFVEESSSSDVCVDPVTRALADDFPSLRDCDDECEE